MPSNDVHSDRDELIEVQLAKRSYQEAISEHITEWSLRNKIVVDAEKRLAEKRQRIRGVE